MDLQTFIGSEESKYAVIALSSYQNDDVAKSLTGSPMVIDFNGHQLVFLSIPVEQVAELVSYAEQAANGVEFELTIGSGKVTLLLHPQALELVQQSSPVEAFHEVQPV